MDLMTACRLSPFSSADSNFLLAIQETSCAAGLESRVRISYRTDKKWWWRERLWRKNNRECLKLPGLLP
jgi:hypothetical protein